MASEATTNWNEDRTSRLERLYREGLSFREIAADIGVTRNAVIGKVHRMQLPTRDVILKTKPVVRRPPPKPRSRRSSSGVIFKVNIKPDPEPDPAVDYKCIITELNDTTCRYPLWDTSTPHEGRFYCGAPGAELSIGQPYCRKHARLCNPQRQ